MLDEIRAKPTAMNVREVAEVLKISEREIYRLAAANRIPHFRIGSSVRFDPVAVATWVEEQIQSIPPRRPPSSVRPRPSLNVEFTLSRTVEALAGFR